MVIGIGLGMLAALRRDRPVDRFLRVVSLAGVSMPLFWLALVALYVCLLLARSGPRLRSAAPGRHPARHVTGLYTVDALLRGRLATFDDALPAPDAARRWCSPPTPSG